MTAPRQIHRGKTYLVTRACLFDRYRLRPSVLTNRIFGYVLARAAEATGVLLHAACVMSNHYHLVITDPLGLLPAFHQRLDSEVARALNALHGLQETFWKPGSYNAVVLDSPSVIVDKCAYVLANPVAAGLVRRGRKWPGLRTDPASFGETLSFDRPGHFFNPEGLTPTAATVQLRVPPGFESLADFRAQVESALSAREDAEASRRSGFLGVARILKARLLDHPREPKPLRSLKPRFAAANAVRRIELALELKAFLAEYRVALTEWRSGSRSVLFPAGTYLMRVMHGAECAGAG